MFDLERAKEFILFKLDNKTYWGRRLINEMDLVKKAPKDRRKIMVKALKELFEDGLLIKKPGNRKQFRYSLRPSRKEEINERIRLYTESKGINFRIFK